MDAATETGKALAKARGRKEPGGVEATIKLKVLEERIADLCTLHEKKSAANDKYNDACKATAEATGLHTATVNKFVTARVGENFEEINGKVQQLALVFDEIGPVKGSRGGTL
jgi:hypothetical protein